jgi:hypothetical protein
MAVIFDLEPLIGQKEIENEFYHFKHHFESRIRRPETRQELVEMVRQINTLK